MIKVFAIGRLCADPELRSTQSGRNVCTFRLAARTAVKGQDGTYLTDFYNVSVWGPQGDTCAKYLKKGSQVAVNGNLHHRAYTDKSGVERVSYDINADSTEFIGGNADAASSDGMRPAPAARTAPKAAPSAGEDDGETLPF